MIRRRLPYPATTLAFTGVAAFSLLFAGWLMAHTFSTGNGYLEIASKAYSDFAAHIPLIRSFSLGRNFPIEYPTFPGQPIRYHFLFYLLVGLMEKTGFPLGFSFNLLSALGFAGLLFLIFYFTYVISSRIGAGILALVLFLCNGSLTFVEFFKIHPLNSATLSDIITASRFASFGPWDGKPVSAFWNLNIYTNQRHLGPSFALGLVVLLPLVLALFRRRPLSRHLVAMVLAAAILPWMNKAVATMVLLTGSLLIGFNFKTLIRLLPWWVGSLLLAAPGLAYWYVIGPDPIVWQPGFLANPSTWLDVARYWWFNLGLYLVLLLPVFLLVKRPAKSIFLAVLPLFILANLFRLSPDMINNHKLVNFFMLFVVMLTATALTALWRRSPWLKPLVAGLTFFLVLSGFIDLFPIINDSKVIIPDVARQPTALWISQNTPKDSVFLTTTYLYHPALLAGRKTYLDYGYFNWSLGYPDSGRRQLQNQMLSAAISPEYLCRLLLQEGIDYIALTTDESFVDQNLEQSTLVHTFSRPIAGAGNGYMMFKVEDKCQ